MKIALLTDTHFGAREGRAIFHNHFEKFYRDVFFPECQKRGITTIIHLGDVFDRRKYIDYFSLKRAKEYFFEPLAESGMRMYTLVGNHDISLRNSLEVNSPSLLLSEYTDIVSVAVPQVIEFNGVPILLCPWICNENKDEVLTSLKTAKAEICMGHFEISGFQMYRGLECKDGYDAKVFSRFDLVFSGHYHHRSYIGNIFYLGSPYEITFADYNDPRGFCIFDTETRDIEVINNKNTLFERYIYDDTLGSPENINIDSFREKFVKIVVQKKTDYYKFDTFLDKVFNSGAYDIKVMEDVTELSAEELDEAIDIEDTVTILTHYIDQSNVVVNREELGRYMKQLYVEAINVQI
jgi:DNA repair exonuclease SbcCD nuclease subunit